MLLFFCAALILGSAAFVSAGPSRVYLPICVLVALGCGRGAHALFTVALCRNNRKLAAILTTVAVFLAGSRHVGVFSRGTTRISGSLSCGAREVRSPCAWRGGARPGSRVTGGD